MSGWLLRPAAAADVEPIAELRATVLATVLARADAEGWTVGLNVLRGSAARRLYERHGFVVEAQDPVDVFMVRPPSSDR